MKKLLLSLGFVLAVLFAPRFASATCTVAHIFSNGDVLTPTVMNANPLNEITCVNNVDNTQIGALGIYASQIMPLTAAQATFGGLQTYTFSVPTNTNGSAPTQDILDLVAGGSKVFWVDNNLGSVHSKGNVSALAFQSNGGTNSIASTPSSPTVAGIWAISQSTGAPNLFQYDINNNQSTVTYNRVSSNGFRITPSNDGAPNIWSVTNAANTGQLVRVDGVNGASATVLATNNGTALAPLLTAVSNNGAALPNSAHFVVQGCATSNSNNCTVSMSNGSQYSNGQTWSCFASVPGTLVPAHANPTNDGTVVTGFYDDAANRTATIVIGCIGY